MSKTHNAGIVTAYGAAVRGGYTGTYEEFCAQQAQYAENARQMEQAVSDVRQIKTSVESAVSEAEGYANNANQSATNASNSATQASESASNANQSAESASQFANNASNSANSASQSATSAQTSATNASTSEQNARQSAETAQDVLDSVQAEGNTQINRVQSEGNTQIGRVQAKGNEILNSLPSDFTQVQNDIAALNGSLDTLGEDLTYVTDKIQHVTPSDWHNTEADTVGSILNANGTTTENANSFYTDFIPVKAGDVVRHYARTSHNAIYRYAVTCYDNNKTVMASAGNNSSASGGFTVPNGVSYVRLTFATDMQSVAVITINLVPTDWSIQYFDPYYTLTRDMVTEEAQLAIDNAKNLKNTTVKGTNLVTNDNTYVGIAYWGSNRIVIDSTQTTYRYVVVPLKQNTRYWVNAYCRYYIFTDDNDNRISSGNTSLGKLFFDSGTATKLYYSLPKNNYDLGFIISEGYNGTLANVSKPTFLDGLNQLMFDSWFAVALPPRTIRFTVGISEKLYYYNILALAKNMIDLSLGTVKDAEGVTVTANSQVIESNAYGYTVYDDNLSVVANAPRGGQNRLTICTDNVQDCSALIIGDSIIARNSGVIGQTMLDAWTERGKTLTLLGTLGTGGNKNEGRPGWTVADYFSNKTYEGVVNPFYNPTSETFDFSYYMSNAGYSAVDYVCIHLCDRLCESFACHGPDAVHVPAYYSHKMPRVL